MECNLTTLGISFGKLDRRGFLRGRKRGVDVAVPRHWALGGCGVGVGAQVSLLSGLLLLRSCGLGHEWLCWGCWPSPRRTLSSPRTNKVSSQNQGARRGDVCLRVRDSEGRQEGNSGPRGGKRMREGGGRQRQAAVSGEANRGGETAERQPHGDESESGHEVEGFGQPRDKTVEPMWQTDG